MVHQQYFPLADIVQLTSVFRCTVCNHISMNKHARLMDSNTVVSYKTCFSKVETKPSNSILKFLFYFNMLHDNGPRDQGYKDFYAGKITTRSF